MPWPLSHEVARDEPMNPMKSARRAWAPSGSAPRCHSILKTNSWVAMTSPESLTHLYCSMALRTGAWNTRGPDRMLTSCTEPLRISACAFTTPSVPSCSAFLGISGLTWVGQATPISARELEGLDGAGGGGGGGGAITGGVTGGVCTEGTATAVGDTGACTSGGGT